MIHFPFDFPMEEPSIWTALYCLVLYLVLLFSNYRTGLSKLYYSYPTEKKEKLSVVFIGFFCITACLNGDFFHFMEFVHNYVYVGGFHNYGEPVYQAIGYFVSNNYLLFRTIVWGGSFIAFCLTAERMGVSKYAAVILLFSSYLITFCYGRVTASMAVYFLGLSYLCSPARHKWMGYILGCVIIMNANVFHRSALIMMLMTVMLILPVRKWSVLLVIVAVPLIANILKGYFVDFAFAEETDEFLADKLQRYSEKERGGGAARLLINTLTYASFYVPLALSSITMFIKHKAEEIDPAIYKMFKVTFGLAYIATSFLLFGEIFITFFYRILNMTMIPLVIIVSKLYKDNMMSKRWFFYCYIPGVLCQIVRMLYMLYLND